MTSLPAVPVIEAGIPRQVGGGPVTVVVAVALLLAATGSFRSPLTVAVLLITPAWRGMTTSVTVGGGE